MSVFSRPLLSGILASAITGSLLAIFMAYVGLRLVQLQATAVIIGVVFFSRNFLQIFLRVPFGELAQIVGRKPLITVGSLFYSIAFVLMYVAGSPLVVIFATFCVAIGMSFYYPAIFSYIGDISNGDYGRINGFIFQGSDIGVIFGTFCASYLLRNDIVDLDGLFGIGSIFGFVGTIIIFLTLSEVLKESEKVETDSAWRAMSSSFKSSISSLMAMTRTRPLGKIYSFQLVISFTEYFFGSFVPLLVVLYIGLTEPQVSDVIFISTIGIFFFKPYLGSISDKFGFRVPVLVSLSITAFSLIGLTFARSIIVVIIIYGIMVASSLTSYLAVNGATSYAAPNNQRGLAMGALGFYVSFGRSTSSAVLTPLWSWYENSTGDQGIALRNVFWIASIIILVGVIGLYFVSRDLDLLAYQGFDDTEDSQGTETLLS